jgi:hypothetical protein
VLPPLEPELRLTEPPPPRLYEPALLEEPPPRLYEPTLDPLFRLYDPVEP